MFLEKLYWCSYCAKQAKNLHEFLKVDEVPARIFCCEECALSFYSPLIGHIKEEEKKVRAELALRESNLEGRHFEASLVEDAMASADEQWFFNFNDFDKIHFFLKKQNNYFMLVAGITVENEVAMILHVTATQSEALIKHFKQTQQKKSEQFSREDESMLQNQLAPELMDKIGNKKSVLLATLLENRSEEDIPFEQYHHYDDFLMQTLQEPEELYEYVDDENDRIMVFIKNFAKGTGAFFYLAICLKDESTGKGMALPILAFPTVDGNLIQLYKQGEKHFSPVLN